MQQRKIFRYVGCVCVENWYYVKGVKATLSAVKRNCGEVLLCEVKIITPVHSTTLTITRPSSTHYHETQHHPPSRNPTPCVPTTPNTSIKHHQPSHLPLQHHPINTQRLLKQYYEVARVKHHVLVTRGNGVMWTWEEARAWGRRHEGRPTLQRQPERGGEPMSPDRRHAAQCSLQ